MADQAASPAEGAGGPVAGKSGAAAGKSGRAAGGPAKGAGGSQHSALCLRLMQLLPRVAKAMRLYQDHAAPQVPAPLTPRHVAALQQLQERPLTVSELAARLDLTLPTVSGVLADLDRAGFAERHPDPADRRRTLVQIAPNQRTRVAEWLDGAAGPLARVLDRLTPSEQAAFVKAMDMLETELRSHDGDR